jgi:hypothetical protein
MYVGLKGGVYLLQNLMKVLGRIRVGTNAKEVYLAGKVRGPFQD